VKILIISEEIAGTVEVLTMPDPTSPWDDDGGDPFYAAQCRTLWCTWNSFVDDNAQHMTPTDAIQDAQVHLLNHEHADT
jgi:hypothetical protein